ncbi:hypothetical protein LCGC14_0732950 [marine sediment metagenome]|uniref:Uncharacterized protein n=1 Tax=marine sediment metagenome TaxID=412755 RepID=A0A0F9SUA2_9ZZZZ
MKVMTEEYCRQCPWFTEGIGYLGSDDPYWKSHPSACMCKMCPSRGKCEAEGPRQDAGDCLIIKYIGG